MKEAIAVFPGSFDPLTNGHENLVRRSAALFERVIVAVAASRKDALFPLDERLAIAREALQPLANVEVISFDCLLVDFLRQHNAKILVRGVRTVADFEYESQMAIINHKLYPDLEVVFLPSSEEHGFISATIVREVARHGGDVSEFVPATVLSHLQQKF